MVATSLMVIGVVAFYGMFNLAQRRALYAIMQNQTMAVLRVETEKLMSTPYADIPVGTRLLGNRALLRLDSNLTPASLANEPGASESSDPSPTADKAYQLPPSLANPFYVQVSLVVVEEADPAYKTIKVIGRWPVDENGKSFWANTRINMLETVVMP
jgi:hypothetical protein